MDYKNAKPRRKWEGSKYVPKRKVCIFCGEKQDVVEYKDPSKLRQFISDRGKIEPHRKTGTCAKHQRAVSVAIKRARHLALLPYIPGHVHDTGGVGIKF
ncbi:MAG TPA: 30S ribosomal protein S18 [Dehalococcoidales bacterium]|nr:30S ribosomal protein S18 [Dehalococcoidales bacterium]